MEKPAAKNRDYQFSIKVKISRSGEHRTGFGPGIAELLSGIECSGSLNQAAKDMNMAYSKAWKIIREVEEKLGFQLIERRGAHGSVLTVQGKKTLEAFFEMEQKATAAARTVFTRFVSDLS